MYFVHLNVSVKIRKLESNLNILFKNNEKVIMKAKGSSQQAKGDIIKS